MRSILLFFLACALLIEWSRAGTITSVTPSSGPQRGCIQVTIEGTGLCNSRSDIEFVKLNTYNVKQIVSWSSTRIVVVAGDTISSGNVGGGEVRVACKVGGVSAGSQYTYITGHITAITPNNGPLLGGNRVTIGGTDLMCCSDTPAVTIWGIPQTLVSVSPTQIVITAVGPSNGVAGHAPMLVTTSCMGEVGGLDYKFNSLGSITSVTPSSGPKNGCKRVTIDGVDLNSGSMSDMVGVELFGAAATVVSVTSSRVVVDAGPSNVAGAGIISVTSKSRGTINSNPNLDNQLYTYIGGVIHAMGPTQGPFIGGTTVTLTGENLGVAGLVSDIYNVMLSGVPATIVSQTSTLVSVIAGHGAVVGKGAVQVFSTCYGTTTDTTFGYTYNSPGNITGVSPSFGPKRGCQILTITGTNLCSGEDDDVTNVIINGYAMQRMVSQTPSQIVVHVGDAGVNHPGGTGPVTVISKARGNTTSANAPGTNYRYVAGAITAITPRVAGLSGGTHVTIDGVNMDVKGDFNDLVRVTINGVTATPNNFGNGDRIIALTPPTTHGNGPVLVESKCYGITVDNIGGFTFNAGGRIDSVVPSRGPRRGCQHVTITGTGLSNGVAGDIFAVTLNGLSASVVSSSATRVIVEAPDAGVNYPGGTGVVTVQSASRGVSTSGYTDTTTYTFTVGRITDVIPNNGRLTGGNTVTILGENLVASSSDINSVTVAGVVATIVRTNATTIVVTTGAVAIPTSGPVVQMTNCFAQTVSDITFTYNALGSVSLVTPNSGPLRGCRTVTIQGTNLCSQTDKSDILSVQLNNVPATVLSQNSTMIVVAAGDAQAVNVVGNGVVTISTVSRGLLTSANTSSTSYTYVAGSISGIVPANGPLAGTNMVTIFGTNLRDFGDPFPSTTLAGVNATVISAAVDGSMMVVNASRSSSARTGAVTVDSLCYGLAILNNAYTYNPAGIINQVSPGFGPKRGCQVVTITGTDLCNGTGGDTHNVFLNGVAVQEIISESPTTIVVRAGDSGAEGTGSKGAVTVMSVSHGRTTGGDVTGRSYHYVGGYISAVTPNIAHVTGNINVTITGVNLGVALNDATDIDGASLVDTAAVVLSATPTQVVVRAGAFGNFSVGGFGIATVSSTCYGITRETNTSGFAYNAGGTVTSIIPAAGPKRGCQIVTITGEGISDGSADDVTAVTLNGQPAAEIISVTNTTVIVRAGDKGELDMGGTGPVQIFSKSCNVTTTANSTGGTFHYKLGRIDSITPNNGPYSGGNLVTISGTDLDVDAGGSVLSVILGGFPATVISNSSSQIVVRAFQSGNTTARSGPVSVTTACMGTTVFASPTGYTFNAMGALHSVTPSSGPRRGCATVTISGQNLCVAGDVENVWLNGVPVASILSQNSTTIVVSAGDAQAADVVGTGNVAVLSTSRGLLSGPVATGKSYTYIGGEITSVTPAVGPLAGVNLVTLQGTHLAQSGDITAVWLAGVMGSYSAAAGGFISTHVTLYAGATPNATVGDIVIESICYGSTVVVNGYEYGPDEGDLSHSLHTMIASNTPTNITLIGKPDAFYRWHTQTCKFQWGAEVAYEPAMYVNRTMVLCQTPAVPAGLVTVSVSNTNTTFGTSIIIRSYALGELQTRNESSFGGGFVTVIHRTIFETTDVTCRFSQGSSVSLMSASSVLAHELHGSVTCPIPGGFVPGMVTMSIVDDGGFAAEYSLLLYGAPNVTATDFGGVIAADSQLVTVFGTDFFPSGASKCKIGSVVVDATYVSNTSITCTAPPQPLGQYPFSASNDGVNFGSTQASFTYYEACTGTVLITAASGTFDDGSGDTGLYGNNMDCQFIIQPTIAPRKILLYFKMFKLQRADLVRVYPGNTTSDMVLAEFTGDMVPTTLLYNCTAMLVRFITDGHQKDDGFKIGYSSYTTDEIPNFTLESPATGSLTTVGSWAFYSLLTLDNPPNISIAMQYSLLGTARRLLGYDSPLDLYVHYQTPPSAHVYTLHTNTSVNGSYSLYLSNPQGGTWYVGIHAARGVGAYALATNIANIPPLQPFQMPLYGIILIAIAGGTLFIVLLVCLLCGRRCQRCCAICCRECCNSRRHTGLQKMTSKKMSVLGLTADRTVARRKGKNKTSVFDLGQPTQKGKGKGKKGKGTQSVDSLFDEPYYTTSAQVESPQAAEKFAEVFAMEEAKVSDMRQAEEQVVTLDIQDTPCALPEMVHDWAHTPGVPDANASINSVGSARSRSNSVHSRQSQRSRSKSNFSASQRRPVPVQSTQSTDTSLELGKEMPPPRPRANSTRSRSNSIHVPLHTSSGAMSTATPTAPTAPTALLQTKPSIPTIQVSVEMTPRQQLLAPEPAQSTQAATGIEPPSPFVMIEDLTSSQFTISPSPMKKPEAGAGAITPRRILTENADLETQLTTPVRPTRSDSPSSFDFTPI